MHTYLKEISDLIIKLCHNNYLNSECLLCPQSLNYCKIIMYMYVIYIFVKINECNFK